MTCSQTQRGVAVLPSKAHAVTSISTQRERIQLASLNSTPNPLRIFSGLSTSSRVFDLPALLPEDTHIHH
eukprot:3735329-Rhodomonas_salina.1